MNKMHTLKQAITAPKHTRTVLGVALAAALLGTVAVLQPPGQARTASVIVQGSDLAAAKAALLAVGGEITHELGIIGAVGARLDETQLETLRDAGGIRRVYENSGIGISAETAPTGTVFSQISSRYDDVEEIGPQGTDLSPGSMFNSSADLEMVRDDDWGVGAQAVGLRFSGLGIPQGAIITDARLVFTAASVNGSTNLTNSYKSASFTVHAQDADNASAFTSTPYNLTNRPGTSAAVAWTPSVWSSGNAYSSPDLSAVVQEVVDRTGWADGNSMVFVITGSGYRSAASYDGSASSAPELIVEYALPGGTEPVADTSPELDCSHLAAEPLMNIGGDKIEWKVYNDGATDLYLNGVMAI